MDFLEKPIDRSDFYFGLALAFGFLVSIWYTIEGINPAISAIPAIAGIGLASIATRKPKEGV
jgi:hypothetical protein